MAVDYVLSSDTYEPWNKIVTSNRYFQSAREILSYEASFTTTTEYHYNSYKHLINAIKYSTWHNL